MTIDIVDWAESRFGFYVDRQYQNGKWTLQPGPIRLADYHARLLRHIFTPDSAGRLPYDVIAWCEPAKSGKSAIAGLVAQHIALHGERNSTIVMASNKQNQAASIMYKSLTDSIALSKVLPNVDPGKYEVTFRNGNTVRAIASNSRGEAGARFTLALFDELWGYQYEDQQRLWSEFKTDPTRTMSLKFAIGYAGYADESELWEKLLKSGLAGEPVPELADLTNGDGSPTCYRAGRTFVFWSHLTRQPWQTDEWLEEQRRTLRPAEFSRMIETEFVEGIGNFCEPEAWAACVSPDHHPLPPHLETPVYVGLDIATSAGGDDCALVGVYRTPDNRVAVAFHKVWKGKERKARLKLSETVKPYLLNIRDNYRLAGVWFDPFQALHLAEELRKAGIRCNEVNQTHASRGPKDTALLDLVEQRRLILYDDSDLKRASSGASAKELGNGMIFLKKASGRAKIDLLVALSNVANEAAFRREPRPAFSYQG